MGERRLAVGVDIGGTKLALGVVDGEGRVVARTEQPTADAAGPSAMLARITAFVRDADPGRAEVGSIGVAVAAAVSGAGAVGYAPHLPALAGYPLGARLRETLGLRTRVLNDGQAALLGECWLGHARGHSDVALVVIGTGVGGAALTDGRLLGGRDGLAGSWGSLGVPDGDRLVPLEAAVAGPALARRATAALGRRCSAGELFALAGGGDAAARALVAAAADRLGAALGAVVAALNPEIVLLGGGLGAHFAQYAASIERRIARAHEGAPRSTVRVQAAALGNDAAWLGAAHAARCAAAFDDSAPG